MYIPFKFDAPRLEPCNVDSCALGDGQEGGVCGVLAVQTSSIFALPHDFSMTFCYFGRVVRIQSHLAGDNCEMSAWDDWGPCSESNVQYSNRRITQVGHDSSDSVHLLSMACVAPDCKSGRDSLSERPRMPWLSHAMACYCMLIS